MFAAVATGNSCGRDPDSGLQGLPQRAGMVGAMKNSVNPQACDPHLS
jgi:hypothetical protein